MEVKICQQKLQRKTWRSYEKEIRNSQHVFLKNCEKTERKFMWGQNEEKNINGGNKK